MGKILFAWELGEGIGHLGPFYAVATQLRRMGHDIVMAVRDPSRAHQMFSDLTSTVVQSPIKPKRHGILHRKPSTYPMILQNVGYSDADSTSCILTAWQSILTDHEPDLIIADHAPGVVFAGLDVAPRVCAIGNGFFVPPPLFPLPSFYGLRTDCISTSEFALKVENEVMATVNRWRASHHLPIFSSVGGAFRRLDAQFLTTFAELDHYAIERNEPYLGALQYVPSVPYDYAWPVGGGPRVFAYLKKSRGLGHLFNRLRDLGMPTIVVMDRMDIGVLNRLATPNLVFYDKPLAIDRIANECDFAVLNATHGATCAFLQAGKPLLQLPRNSEQSSTAMRTVELNAGLVAHPDDGAQIEQSFLAMLPDLQRFDGAAQFAARHAKRSSRLNAERVARQIDQIVSWSSSRRL